jgi:hypothetical protein
MRVARWSRKTVLLFLGLVFVAGAWAWTPYFTLNLPFPFNQDRAARYAQVIAYISNLGSMGQVGIVVAGGGEIGLLKYNDGVSEYGRFTYAADGTVTGEVAIVFMIRSTAGELFGPTAQCYAPTIFQGYYTWYDMYNSTGYLGSTDRQFIVTNTIPGSRMNCT